MAQIRLIFEGFRQARRSWVWLGLRGRAALLPALLFVALAARGQGSASAAPQDVETALHQMSDRADVIFVGQVTAVRRVDGGNVASGVVEVEFRVDQAIRGCTAGAPYVLREWAGLWEVGALRYRVGQRLLMLLHAPGVAGMSSPVDGLDGAIPVVRGGSAPLAGESAGRMSPPAVDLRWVGIKLLHPVSYGSGAGRGPRAGMGPAPPVARSQMVRGVAAGAVVEVAPPPVLPAGEGPGMASVPAQQASVDAVVGMLQSWSKVRSKVQHGSR
jgi:hypothetical protein